MADPTFPHYQSFLLRIWGVEDKADRIAWHCEIEHIQLGHRWTFETMDELLDFLYHQAQEPFELDRGSQSDSPSG